MVELTLTDRQRRERAYYDTYSRLSAPAEVSFDPVVGEQRRPWNSYWYLAELAVKGFKSSEQRLLDFGCGPGYYSMQYAKIGYDVYGFDISASNIEHARGLSRTYQCEQKTHFQVGIAETLDYPDRFFDIIIGVDILHHVDIGKAMDECRRVLKPGGVAIFHEPIRVPAFDGLRDSKFGLWLAPKTVSFETHITEDEKKLCDSDLDVIRTLDPGMTVQRFLLFSRFEKVLRSQHEHLEQLDFRLIQLMPFLGKFGGRLVVTLRP